MSFAQRSVTHAEWTAMGGWQPVDYEPADDDIVIYCTTDADVLDGGSVVQPAQSVVWASWASKDEPVADRLNTGVV